MPDFVAVLHDDCTMYCPFVRLRRSRRWKDNRTVEMQKMLFQYLPKVQDEVRPARRTKEMRYRYRQSVIDRRWRECLLIFVIRDCFEAGVADASL